jgi:hypothetical protein
VLSGCDPTPQHAPRHDAPADAVTAADTQQVNEMLAQTREETLEARVATLENQVDTLKAEVDTRADLGSALAVPAAIPSAARPLPPPKLPYEPPADH